MNGASRLNNASTGGGPPRGSGVGRQHGNNTRQATVEHSANNSGQTSTASTDDSASRANGGQGNPSSNGNYRRNNKSTGSKKRGQRRAAHLRENGNLTRSQHSAIHNFNKKRQRVKASNQPTHRQLREATLHESGTEQNKHSEAQAIQAAALDIYTAGQDEERIVSEIVSQWKEGGHGYVPEVKPEDVVRLSGENTNSLSLFAPQQWKLKKMANLNNKYQTDGTMLVETGTNWDEVPAEKGPSNLFSGAHRCHVVAAHNKNDNISSRSQPGGTAVAAFSRLSSFILESGQDSTGLGRWSWIRVGTEGRKTRIITAYQPVSPSRRGQDTNRRTVWHQHRRYLGRKGCFVTHGLCSFATW